ncbi:MAG: hypothetical protein ACRD8U_09685, partial [Pyrinomonadaceae bacterium]
MRRYAGRLNISHPIMVSTVPNACDYVGCLGERQVVYYCVDDFTKWPGLEHHLIDAMERELIGKANVLVVASQTLYRKLIMNKKPTHLLTHGVDISLFAHDPPAEHECLEGIARPRVGFFGLIDQRTDQGLIAGIASRMLHFSFVMTGPIATDVASLQACSNIHFTGPVAYGKLPALIKGLAVLFIPYVVNDFTDSISPLKLKEYLVTGKPVIATPMAEAISRRQYVSIASSVDEWEVALSSTLSVDVTTRRQAILELLAGESW